MCADDGAIMCADSTNVWSRWCVCDDKFYFTTYSHVVLSATTYTSGVKCALHNQSVQLLAIYSTI